MSALLTPVIGIAVAYIAWQQWRTARNKLKLDLFDRRLPIYERTRAFLARRMALRQLDHNEITEFAIETRVSRWLFNPAMAQYLEGEIVKKAMDLATLHSELEGLTGEAHKENLSRQRELKNWLDVQLYKVIDTKFGKYLHVRH